jgi:hypothetical protein
MNDTGAQGNQGTTTKDNVETVRMSDNRLVDFAGKRKLLKESIVRDNGSVAVRLDFRNGETRTYELPEKLLGKFAAHGAEQKYGDETAGVEDVDDMVLAVDELNDRIQKLEWSTKSTGGGMSGTSVLVRALVEHTGKALDAIKAFLKEKTQAEKLALRNNPKIRPIVEKLEAEKVAKSTKVDTDAMLGELAA